MQKEKGHYGPTYPVHGRRSVQQAGSQWEGQVGQKDGTDLPAWTPWEGLYLIIGQTLARRWTAVPSLHVIRMQQPHG